MLSHFIIFTCRILKKVNILKFITVSIPVILNNKKNTVLLRKGIGYPNLFVKEDFLLKLMRLFLPTKPGLFVDAGTNTGQTLMKVKSVDKNRQYIGFEPNQVCFAYTTDLIRLNNYTNCEIREYALADKNKVVNLCLNEATDAAASIIEKLRPDYFRSSVPVNCIAFDESGITGPIAILKIDVEGAELEVLMGTQKAIDAFRPLIVCEVLDCYSAEVLEFTQQRADSLCHLLRERGYIIFWLHQGEKRIDTFMQVDSITINVWSPASYELNDYLFCHATFEQEMIGLLNQLSAV